MDFDIITAFPGMFESPLSHSIVRRARDRGIISVRVHDLRDSATGKHHKVDDVPYGGGGGLGLIPPPFFAPVATLLERDPHHAPRTHPPSPPCDPAHQR